MSARRLPMSRLARFFAILLIVLAVSPVTQPFSTLGVSDFFEESTGGATSMHDIKANEEPATLGAVFSTPADHVVRGEAIVSTRALTIARHDSPIVLRI